VWTWIVCGPSIASDGVVFPTRAAGFISPAGNSYHSMELTVGSVVMPHDTEAVDMPLPRY